MQEGSKASLTASTTFMAIMVAVIGLLYKEEALVNVKNYIYWAIFFGSTSFISSCANLTQISCWGSKEGLKLLSRFLVFFQFLFLIVMILFTAIVIHLLLYK